LAFEFWLKNIPELQHAIIYKVNFSSKDRDYLTNAKTFSSKPSVNE